MLVGINSFGFGGANGHCLIEEYRPRLKTVFPFSVPVVKHKAAIRGLDLSLFKRKLAVVDEHASLTVYEVKGGKVRRDEPNAPQNPPSAEGILPTPWKHPKMLLRRGFFKGLLL